MLAKNTICLWYDGTPLDAATLYAATFPNTAVSAVYHAPAITRRASRGTC